MLDSIITGHRKYFNIDFLALKRQNFVIFYTTLKKRCCHIRLLDL